MITLYKNKNGRKAEEIEEKLKELVLAFRVEELPEENSEPFIVDGDQKIKGDANLDSWLRELEGELKWQRSLSADACYIDPDTHEMC